MLVEHSIWFKKLVMMENIIISNPEKLEEKKKAIFKDGAEKLQIISDFDRTLTRSFVDGQKSFSLISVLGEGNYLTHDYSQKAQALFEKYYPIEKDPNIIISEKKKMMSEWWQSHFELLIDSELNKRDIEKAIDSGKVEFREGASDFFDSLSFKKIPLIILSANGLGKDATEMFFEKNGKMFENTYIISNSLEWNEKGDMIGFREPIIHSMNKDDIFLKDFPDIFQRVENRKNVLLLGDNLGDVKMANGFEYENLIKIGFLNEGIEQHLEYYKDNYDIVMLNDSPMDYINELLKEIL